MNKKFFVAGFAAMSVLAMTVSASAENQTDSSMVSVPVEKIISLKEIAADEIKEANIVKGKVKEVKGTQIFITNETLTNPNDAIMINVNEAKFIDASTGKISSIADIKAGENISAYCNPISIMIYPPQYGAHTILFNENKGGVTSFLMVTNEQIMIKKVDGSLPSVNFTSADGAYMAMFDKNTDITTPDGRILGYRDIKKDMIALVFCDGIRESYPASVTVKKAVIYNYAPQEIKIDAKNIIIDGTAAGELNDNKPFTDKNGNKMYPVRAIAEALGYDVGWENGKVTIMKIDQVFSAFKLGESGFTHFDTQKELENSAKFVNVNGYAFAPESFFENILNCNID